MVDQYTWDTQPTYEMYHRQLTPPTIIGAYPAPDSVHSRSTSGASVYSHDSSPYSVMTSNTTPPRSPVIRENGPKLLPKPRNQDQVLEPSAGPIRHRHTSSSSSFNNASGFYPYPQKRPSIDRRATSPPFTDMPLLVSPISAPSPYGDSGVNSQLNSPITFQPSHSRRPSLNTHSRSHSASGIRTHSRSASSTSVDQLALGRFGYPTYRQLPNYVTNSSSTVASTSSLAMSSATAAHLAPLGSSFYPSAPAPAVQEPAHPSPFDLPLELQFDDYNQTSTTSLLSYLTSPNPSPSLVRRIAAPTRGPHTTHFWWDVRNLRQWTDFNVSTIHSIPGLTQLLNVPIPSHALPVTGRINDTPETEAQLQDIVTAHYASHLNAALKVALGVNYISMTPKRPTPGARPTPDFVSQYQNDYEKTIYGDGRGRVVGLVKAYDAWNTGMRAEAANKQVHYLQGLAQLHRYMREHGCRYGFIMTEVELVCVRAGGPMEADNNSNNAAGSDIPLFGFLELAKPIQLSTHAATSFSAPQEDTPLTALLALWYLHMLARDTPLQGQPSWRMDCGGPVALTRQNVLGERDEWVPKPQVGEKREAKRLRGWVWPEDPLSRRESGRGRRK